MTFHYRCFSLFIIIGFLSLQITQLHAQNSDKDQSFILSYSPPLDKNGLTNVTVKLRTRITKAAGEMFLCYAADCSGNLEYQYNGRRYSNGEWSMAIRNILPVDPVIQLEVILPNQSSKIYTVDVLTGQSSSVLGVNSTGIPNIKIGDLLEPEKYHVRFAKVISMSHRNTSEIIKLIDNKDKQNKITDLRNLASNALNGKQYQRAIELNNQILSVDFNDAQAKMDLEKIKSLIREDELSNKYADLMRKGQQAEQAKNLTQAAQFFEQASRIPLSKGNIGESEAIRIRNIIAQQNKESESQVNKNKGISGTSRNESDVSSKNLGAYSPKTLSNNEQYSQNPQPTKEDIERQKKLYQQRAIDSLANKLQADTEKYFENQRIQKAKDEENTRVRMAVYNSSKEVTNVKDNIKNNSRLENIYNSIQDLENDYNQKLQNLTGSGSQLAGAQSRQLNAAVDYVFNDDKLSQYKALGSATAGFGSMLNELAAQKAEEKARRALAEQRAAAIRNIKMQKVTMRRGLIKNFQEGDLPLYSHRIKVPQVFMFAYVIDSTRIQDEFPSVKITNIFPIAQYRDESWPLKKGIRSELQVLMKQPNFVLFGYFTTEEKAKELYDTFLRIAKSADMQVVSINYAGRPFKSIADSKFNSTNSEPQTDFFGNPIQKKSSVETDLPQQIQIKKVDFFGNPIKN
jgi:hypothetical protein